MPILVSLRRILCRPVSWKLVLIVPTICLGWWAIAGGLGCSREQARLEGDTPEICRVYLEQDAAVLAQFGRLQVVRFQPGQSCAFADEAHAGYRQGVYIFAVSGTRAEGRLKVAWNREPGDKGSFWLLCLQTLDCTPVSRPRPVPAVAVPRAPARLPFLPFTAA